MKETVMAKCPRCREEKDMTFPALSRVDNKTYICSPCGVGEALDQYWGFDLQPLEV
jgi:predicted RNA-binding Zn-ribbon protein involved in translation (DUF1610 family)